MEKTKEILNNTVPFLKEAGKFSFGATVKVLSVIILFSLVNLGFLSYGLYAFFNNDQANGKGYLLGIMALIAVFSTVFASLKMYNYVTIDAARVFFGTIDDFKRKVAEKLISRFETGINDSSTEKTKLNQLINVADIATDLYGKVPKFAIRIFNFIVGKIPLIAFSSEIKQHLAKGNKNEAIDYFVLKTNEFFKENIFDQNSTRIVYIILLLTITFQYLIIHFL